MNQYSQLFEQLKNFNENGCEYWSARDLYPLLEYNKWQSFQKVINRAMQACATIGHPVSNHFTEMSKMVDIGSSAQRKLEDIILSRYACYLVVQNGDPSKPAIAAGQTYFAIQTRRQELSDDLSLKEDYRRLLLRNELKKHNKQLNSTAYKAGVETSLDFAIFQNHGYKGLYGGIDKNGIHKYKGLKKNQKILDFMGSTELAANLFRATQAEEKLRRDNINGKKEANQAHLIVGRKVRKTIKDLGGTMPENLPTPKISINQLLSENKVSNNKNKKEYKLEKSELDKKHVSMLAKFIKGNTTHYVKLRRGPKKTWKLMMWIRKNDEYKKLQSISFKLNEYERARQNYILNCEYLLLDGYNPTPCN